MLATAALFLVLATARDGELGSRSGCCSRMCFVRRRELMQQVGSAPGMDGMAKAHIVHVHQVGPAGADGVGAACEVGVHDEVAWRLKASKSECKGEVASSLLALSWEVGRFFSVLGAAGLKVAMEVVHAGGSSFTITTAGGGVGGGRFGSAAASPPSRRPQPLQDEAGELPAPAAEPRPASCCSMATNWAWLLSILESNFVAVSTCWCSS